MALEQQLFGDTLPSESTLAREAPDVALFQRPVLDSLLEVFGQTKDFRSRRIRCPACDSRVTWKNLRVVVARNGTADFICDGTICYDEYLNQSKGS